MSLRVFFLILKNYAIVIVPFFEIEAALFPEGSCIISGNILLKVCLCSAICLSFLINQRRISKYRKGSFNSTSLQSL